MNTMTTEPTVSTTQRPAIRLLDLLAGWEHFVARAQEPQDPEDAPVVDDRLPSGDIYDLYQEAGAWTFDAALGDVSAEEEAVRIFLNERVLPLLLRKTD